MSNADYLASAFVQIRPKTTGFQKELRDQVKKAVEPIKPTVNVLPTTSGFIASLRTQVREAIAKSGPHYVPVTPTLTAFRAQLAKELSEKPIPVTVAPVGKAATGAKEAVGAEKTLTDASRNRKVITDQLRDSERLLKQSTLEGLSIKERDTLVTKAQALAREALTRITEGQIAGERVLIQEQLRARGIKAETRAGREAGALADEKTRLEGEAKAAEAASIKEKLLADTKENLAKVSDRLIINMDEFHKIAKQGLQPTEALSKVESKLNVIEKERVALLEQLQGAQRRGEKEQAKLIKRGVEQAATFREIVKVEQARLTSAKAAEALSSSEQRIANRLAKATTAQIESLTTLKAVRAQENVLQRQSTALDKLEEVAQERNAAATLSFVNAKRLEIEARQAALARQGDFIRNTQKEVTTQKNVGRGLIATGLSFLGLRGATLAAGGAFLAGAAAAATFAKAVTSAASLEQELNVFQATSEATADEMERVSETARELGADITLPAVGASDAAQAMTQLAKAGLDVRDAMDGARGTLQLATAAEISNAEATELVASALNSFGLAGIEATRVADLLTGAANEAQGTITDMGIALQQSSAVARQAGLSLEDTVAFITLLAKNGIRGSDAGTSLRTALLRLIAPTKEANKALNNLGLDLLDTAGNLRPEIFSELDSALQGLNATARNQTLKKIFGQDAIRAAVIFGREGTKGLNAVRDATQQAGLASELAEARTKGFSGQVAALRNNAETLGLTLGKLTLGPLGAFIDTLNEGVRAANDLTGAIADMNEKNKQAAFGSGGGGGFFGDLKDILFRTGGDQLREIRATVDILKSGNRRNILSGTSLSNVENLKAINLQILETVTNTQNLSEELRNVASPEDAIDALESLSDRLIGNSEDAELARQKISEIQSLIIALGRVPTIIELSILLDQRGITTGLQSIKDRVKNTVLDVQLSIADATARALLLRAKVTGENAADLFHAAFKGTLTPEAFKEIMDRYFSAIPSSIEQANANLNDNALFADPAQGLTGKQILGRIAGFDAAKVRAELSGSTAELIGVLRAEQAFLEQQLQRELVQKQPGLKRAIESALLGVQNDLEAIASDQKQAAEESAEKIRKANEDAANALISVFSGQEQKRLNQQTLAAQSESLRDDIVTANALIALYEKQKTIAKKKIKDAEILADFLADTNQKIFELEIEIQSDKKKLNQQLRQERREQRERIIEGIELDIELSVINENRRREIALRKKLIRALEEQIKREKGNTNKIKELRNEIARQKQAIKDAKEETEDRNKEFQAFLFAQLQAQQGFAANLISNILGEELNNTIGQIGASAETVRPIIGAKPIGPITGATAGAAVVQPITGIDRSRFPEGRPQVGGGITTQAAIAEAKAGPTRGGQNRELFLLERIARLLEEIKRGGRFPEANYQKERAGTAWEHGRGTGSAAH